MNKLTDKIEGCLLGGMIGDAFGAPGEGMTYEEIKLKFGEDGLTDFEGLGTDDTAVRNQLISTILDSNGYPNVDSFAQSFINTSKQNYKLWFVPVRNAYHKVADGVSLPAYAGWGNMQSSSTAMAISPMGIINACNPRQAALETLELASLIHNGPTGFCRDAACSISAAVSEAFTPGSDIERVIKSASEFLLPVSAKELSGLISSALDMATRTGSYEEFREEYYSRCLRSVICDSRETIPATFAILQLSQGDPKKAITWAANFGRDADTIASMVGGIVGALHGSSGLPTEWVEKAMGSSQGQANYSGNFYSDESSVEETIRFDYGEISRQLSEIVQARRKAVLDTTKSIESLL